MRQSIYYPYAWGLRYARGRLLDVRVEAETYPISGAGLQADFARNDQVVRDRVMSRGDFGAAPAEDIVVMKALAGRPKSTDDVVAIVASPADALDWRLGAAVINPAEPVFDPHRGECAAGPGQP